MQTISITVSSSIMEKDTVESSDSTARKAEARRAKRRQPEAIGSVAIEPETAESTLARQLAKSARSERLSYKRRQAVEARRLHSAPPERIGHMLMSAEAKPGSSGGKPALEKSAGDSLPMEMGSQRAETLSRAELMTLSERIIIDGSNLHQIYETHLIGERGLRRLVAEYLRGGDLKQALRFEVVERERDFERDPVMRDLKPQPELSSTVSASNHQAALDKLLEQADISSEDRGEEAAFFKARARFEAREHHQHKQRRRSMDIGLGAVILVLIILVVALFLTRS
jgi:hypothetical protein